MPGHFFINKREGKYLMMKIAILFLIINCSTSLAMMGMKTLGGEYKVKADSLIEITNMPKVRSQDTVGVCAPFVTCTMIDEINCVAKSVENCKATSDSEKCSPLDVSRYTREVEAAKKKSVYNFQGLNMDSGSSVSIALFNTISGTRSVVKESCAPFDQVVAKIDDKVQAQRMEGALWNRLRKAYDSYKRESEKCLKCAVDSIHASGIDDDLKQNYSIKASNEEILKAFAEESYEKFLDKLLIPAECWKVPGTITVRGNWKPDIFPKAEQSRPNYDETIEKIKDILKKKRPIGLNFCAQEPLVAKSRDSCSSMMSTQVIGGQHDVIIHGYRKVCNQKNICRDVVKIQNSWGESWQTANDDGWVDAKEILDRTFYEPDTMVWLEKSM